MVNVLNGHANKIDRLCFGNNVAQPVVASACYSVINVWHFSQNGESYRCTQIGKDLGHVTHLAFSPDDVALLAVIEHELWFINVQTSDLIATLSTSESFKIFVAEFCPPKPHLVVALTECRTYHIFDLNEKAEIYQSLIPGSAFLCLSMHPFEACFATGSIDGWLHVLDMTSPNSIHKFHPAKAITKATGEDDFDNAVKKLKYWNKSKPLLDDDNAIRAVVNEELYLAVFCTSAILILNVNSMEVLSVFMLSDIQLENSLSLSVARNVAWGISTGDKMTMALPSYFSNDIHICSVWDKKGLMPSNLTTLSMEPLVEDSPLRVSGLCPKTKQVDKKSKKPAKGDKMNQPLVFHGNIKSSGYSKEKPRGQMFQPKVNKPKAKSSSSIAVGPWGSKSEGRLEKKEYPMESAAPTNLAKEQVITQNDSGIAFLSFSDSGKSLACANADHSALLLKTATMKSLLFNGHDAMVNTALMNHENNLLITSSDDSTVKLWIPEETEAILDISNFKHNFKRESIKCASDKTNPHFTKSIGRAQFYYLDKFIMLSYGNSLLLYNYYIDPEKNDVKRYKSNNKYKLVKEFQVSESQKITAFSAINSFYSYLSICACSNRDLVVFDINKAQPVLTINDAHTRPVQSLCQNQGSAFVTQTSEAYDLFITAAVTDGVKLWDLRLNRCVRKFVGHVNRAHKVGLAYSPCSRFIAVGSEDNSTYLYDIRAGSHLHRLSGHNNVVTALAFHPQYPLLACGSLSGKLQTYDIK